MVSSKLFLIAKKMISKKHKQDKMRYIQTMAEFDRIWERWTTLTDSVYSDAKISELMSTEIGRYLDRHPVLALSVLVFGVIATVPIGLFLVFALMTSFVTAVGCAFFEVVLLSVGGLSLLCVLTGLALLSLFISSILKFCFATGSTVYQVFCTQQNGGNT